MALSSKTNTGTAEAVPLAKVITDTYGDSECDPRGLFGACFDGMLAMNPKASLGLGRYSQKVKYPTGETEWVNLCGLYDRLAAWKQAEKDSAFTTAADLSGEHVREVLIAEGVFDSLTRKGFLLRADPNRPAFSRTSKLATSQM